MVRADLGSATIFIAVLLFSQCYAALSKISPSIVFRGGFIRSKCFAERAAAPISCAGMDDMSKNSPPLGMSCAHWMTADDCLASLEVNRQLGLSQDEATRRLSMFGENSLQTPERPSILSLLKEQFEDKLIRVLMGVAIVSSIAAALDSTPGSFAEPLVIFAILLLNAAMGIWQQRSAESSLDALKKLQSDTCNVFRSGKWFSNFPSRMLVPGDIISVRAGDKVPADARVMEVASSVLCADESTLTGESDSVDKSVIAVAADASLAGKVNMLFSGTVITRGSGTAVVVQTGPRTEIGIINDGLQRADELHTKTPLALQLDVLGNQIVMAVGWVCAVIWLTAFPKFSHSAFPTKLHGALHYAKSAVSLGVAAIPEGLPAVITLCLSLGTRRMAKRNVIVRSLPAIETLGCTSVICTDKTGTLTTNQMTVRSLLSFSKESGGSLIINDHRVDGVSYQPDGEISGLTCTDIASPGINNIAKICALCSEASLDLREDGRVVPVGEPTEAALKVFAEKISRNGVCTSSNLQQSCTTASMSNVNRYADTIKERYKRLALLEFNRDRKSMSCLVRSVNEENELLTKGAAEVLLDRCDSIMLHDGEVASITPKVRETIRTKLLSLASTPYRCIALAVKSGAALKELGDIENVEQAGQVAGLQDATQFAEIESGLTLVGICGIQDPARPEAREAIDKCRAAGIRVMMMTGDSKETAVAIARDVHIFTPSDEIDLSAHVFTGREFMSFSESQQLDFLRSGNKVFCRTEPKDKQRLISLLQQLGEIPAMTGDGVNDAPALRQAAIGIAMGVTGSEVAKSAADMIVTDDNFATIVAAVEQGRSVFANMQSFIGFLLSANLGELITLCAASLLGLPEPLSSTHLLWMNLVTDGPPATALSFNPSDPHAMMSPPRSARQPIVSKKTLLRYLLSGLHVGVAALGVFVWWFADKGVSFAQLRHWTSCDNWIDFLHSADAPNWPTLPCNIFKKNSLVRPQTMVLSVLAVVEILKALSAVSLKRSIFSVYPWENPWLVASVVGSMALHLTAMYIPFLNSILGLAPLTWPEWKVVLAFSLPMLATEELLKWSMRRKDARTKST